MRFARVRLVVAVALLFAWLGSLAYQALAIGRFPVVSHAQLLVSTLDVIAEVRAGSDRRVASVRVESVHWPADQKKLEGQEIEVVNILNTTLPDGTPIPGPGRYILPLVAG